MADDADSEPSLKANGDVTDPEPNVVETIGRLQVLERSMTAYMLISAALFLVLWPDQPTTADRGREGLLLILGVALVWTAGLSKVKISAVSGVLQLDENMGARRFRCWTAVAVGWLVAGLAVLILGVVGFAAFRNAELLDQTWVRLAPVTSGCAGLAIVAFARLSRPNDPTHLSSQPKVLGERNTDVVACLSGGGLRAAAFSLGALRVLMKQGPNATPPTPTSIVAVSGGAYLGAAYVSVANSRDDSSEVDVFAPNSPEEQRLRRHTNDLLGSVPAKLTAVLSVFVGMVLNLLMVITQLYAAAWFLGTLLARVGVLDPTQLAPRIMSDSATGRGMVPPTWFAILSGAVLALGVVSFMLDRVVVGKFGRPAGVPWLRKFAPHIVAAGLAIAALAWVVPWSIVQLNTVAVSNSPSLEVSRVAYLARFATDEACHRALTTSFDEAKDAATQSAEQSQAKDGKAATAPATFSFGACGVQTTASTEAGHAADVLPEVSHPEGGQWQRFFPEDTDSPVRDREPSQIINEIAFIRSGADTGRAAPGADIAGLATFLAILAAVIRLAATTVDPSPSAGLIKSSLARAWSAVKTVVLPWVGALVLAVLALRTLLVFTRDFAIGTPPKALFLGRLSQLIAERASVPVGIAQALSVIGTMVVLWLLIDANSGSLYPFYRERLSRAFLLERQSTGQSAQAVERTSSQDLKFSELVGSGPSLHISAAANVSDHGVVLPERDCVPFLFGSKKIGVSDSALPFGPGLQDTKIFEKSANPDATVGAAMAISGAAFSPMMGRKNAGFKPYRLLLAFANARLGVWLPNPYWTQNSQPRWLGLRKAGPFRLYKEAFGRSSIYDNRLYVTDGGHYDNTGLVEALRQKPSTVYVVDASNDQEDSFLALGDAIATARMDLGVSIDIELSPMTRGVDNNAASQAWTNGSAAYPDGHIAKIYVCKNILSADAPSDVRSHVYKDKSFPRSSTFDQFYGEFEFEAYRRLGEHNAERMIKQDLAPRPSRLRSLSRTGRSRRSRPPAE